MDIFGRKKGKKRAGSKTGSVQEEEEIRQAKGISRQHSNTSKGSEEEFNEALSASGIGLEPPGSFTAGQLSNPLLSYQSSVSGPSTFFHQEAAKLRRQSLYPPLPYIPVEQQAWPIQPPKTLPHLSSSLPPVPPPPPPLLPPNPITTMTTPAPIEKKQGREPVIFSDPRDWEEWNRILILFMLMNPTRFSDDIKKIQYVITCMQGNALGQWAQTFTEAVMWKAAAAGWSGAPTSADWGNWTTFHAALKKSFEDPNKKKTAPERLEVLTQKKRRASSTRDAFFQLFEPLVQEVGLNGQDTLLIDLLEKKLHFDIIQRIYNSTVPTAYADYKEKAIQHDNLQHMVARLQASQHGRPTHLVYNRPMSNTPSGSNGHSREDRQTATGTTYGGAGKPMQIGRIQVNKEEAHKKGLCYGCGRSGHLSKECPHKKKLYNPQLSSSSNRSQQSWQQQGPRLRPRTHERFARLLQGDDSRRAYRSWQEGFLHVWRTMPQHLQTRTIVYNMDNHLRIVTLRLLSLLTTLLTQWKIQIRYHRVDYIFVEFDCVPYRKVCAWHTSTSETSLGNELTLIVHRSNLIKASNKV